MTKSICCSACATKFEFDPALLEVHCPQCNRRYYRKGDGDAAWHMDVQIQEQSSRVSDDAVAEFAIRYPRMGDFCRMIYDGMTPRELSFMEPKKLVPPGGYNTPKCIPALLYSTIGENALKYRAEDFIAPTQVTAQGLCYEILNNGVPIYYVKEAFIRAVVATELPGDMRGDELCWPAPAFVLGLPDRFSREYFGADIGYVFAALQRAGDHNCKHLPGAPTTVVPKDKMSWMWCMYDKGYLHSSVSSYWNSDYLAKFVTDYVYTDYAGETEAEVERASETTNLMALLMVKLLAVLSMRDGLIKPASVERPAKTYAGGSTVPALWSPNMIGSNYQLLTDRTPVGTHASPRLHVRRKHATWQVVGKKTDKFVPAGVLPRTELGYIDWEAVDPETRTNFMATHKRIWIDALVVGATE